MGGLHEVALYHLAMVEADMRLEFLNLFTHPRSLVSLW